MCVKYVYWLADGMQNEYKVAHPNSAYELVELDGPGAVGVEAVKELVVVVSLQEGGHSRVVQALDKLVPRQVAATVVVHAPEHPAYPKQMPLRNIYISCVERLPQPSLFGQREVNLAFKQLFVPSYGLYVIRTLCG